MWDHIQKYWLTYAMGIVAGGLGALWKWVRGKFRTLDAMKDANLALLHDRLYQGCKHYIAQGHIDVDTRHRELCRHRQLGRQAHIEIFCAP